MQKGQIRCFTLVNALERNLRCIVHELIAMTLRNLLGDALQRVCLPSPGARFLRHGRSFGSGYRLDSEHVRRPGKCYFINRKAAHGQRQIFTRGIPVQAGKPRSHFTAFVYEPVMLEASVTVHE